MRAPVLCALLVLVCMRTGLAAPIEVAVTQDNSIVMVDGEWSANAGGRVRVKGNQHIGMTMKTILAPVDFSSATSLVLREAATLARSQAGRVVLLHVTEPATGVADYAIVVMSVAHINEASVKHALERLEQLKGELRNEGVAGETVHVVGSPVPEIVEQARNLAADYIVIGSHGHTAFYDLLVGSTASGVLKRSPCPVLIVPPPKVSEESR